MFLRRLLRLAAVILLAGCSVAPPVAAPTAAPVFPPQATQATVTPASAVAEMVTETPAATAALTAAVTGQASPAYPVTGAAATPNASAYPGVGQGLLPGGTGGQSAFKDCARTPGIAGCDPQAAGLAGHLAFIDPSAQRVVALDLHSGQGWQISLKPVWLEWSPGGKQLLAALGQRSYAVYSAQGQPGQTFTLPENALAEPTWLTDGSLSQSGTVASLDGTQARLEYTPDNTWLLHVKPAQGQEQVIPLEAQPTDRLYQIAGWASGSELLVQRYFASNSAMLVGGEVLVVDTASGAAAAASPVQSLNVTAPLNSGASFAAQPVAVGRQTTGLVALMVSGGEMMGARRLGLLDVATHQVRYPLPEGITVSGLAWQPDGAGLTFSAFPGETAAAEARQLIPGAGIYRLDPASGAVTTLVASPEGAQDAWPHWTADGATLIYARVITPASGSPTAQIRAHQGNRDWTLVDGLAAPESILGAGAWRAAAAFGE